MDSFAQTHSELLQYIFSFLAPAYRLLARLTCRRWCELLPGRTQVGVNSFLRAGAPVDLVRYAARCIAPCINVRQSLACYSYAVYNYLEEEAKANYIYERPVKVTKSAILHKCTEVVVAKPATLVDAATSALSDNPDLFEYCVELLTNQCAASDSPKLVLSGAIADAIPVSLRMEAASKAAAHGLMANFERLFRELLDSAHMFHTLRTPGGAVFDIDYAVRRCVWRLLEQPRVETVVMFDAAIVRIVPHVNVCYSRLPTWTSIRSVEMLWFNCELRRGNFCAGELHKLLAQQSPESPVVTTDIYARYTIDQIACYHPKIAYQWTRDAIMRGASLQEELRPLRKAFHTRRKAEADAIADIIIMAISAGLDAKYHCAAAFVQLPAESACRLIKLIPSTSFNEYIRVVTELGYLRKVVEDPRRVRALVERCDELHVYGMFRRAASLCGFIAETAVNMRALPTLAWILPRWNAAAPPLCKWKKLFDTTCAQGRKDRLEALAWVEKNKQYLDRSQGN